MAIRSKIIYIIITLIFLTLISQSFGQSKVYPGLFDENGIEHPLHTPNPVTGQTINVVDFGADPEDNENDDRPAIEQALESAEFGDELYFPSGTYNFNTTLSGETSTHICPKSGINWRGKSLNSTIIKSGYGDKTIQRFFKMRGVHDIVFSDLTITSAFNGKYSTDRTSNNPEAGGPRYVLSIEEDSGVPCYNIVIDSVLVEKYRTHGVRLSNSHDVIVKNSIFQNTTDVGGGGAGYGVSIQGNGKHDNNSKYNVVENSRFLGPYMRHGILLQYAAHNNVVRYNYLEDNRLDAIDLHGEDEYLNEIHENEVRNIPTGAGVGVGNTGSTHDNSGPHNYIHHNLFINCREGVKVYLGSPNTRIEYNTITQSNVSSGKGIYILNGPRTIIKGNQIYSNTGPGFSGITLQYDGGTQGKGKGDPEDVRILGNHIYDNPYGVRLFYGQRIIYEDNNVQNNHIQDYYASGNVTFNKLLSIINEGTGRVVTDPEGDSFAEGSIVTLTALPWGNFQFDHWEGDYTGSENPASITMDVSKKITAVFIEKLDSDEVNLFVNVKGEGNVILNPPNNVYDRGTTVYITAVPDSAWKFSNWSGHLNSTSMTDSIIMDGDREITAHFERAQMFAIVPWIVGSGELILDPQGEKYLEGTTVVLTAVPDEGWEFSSWGGALSGKQNPDSLVIDEQKPVMVTFVQSTWIDFETVPLSYELKQNYPNPFNGYTTITFSLEKEGEVSLEIFDIKGRLVETLINESMRSGQYNLSWNPVNVTSGVYFYRLKTEGFTKTKKLILSK